MDFEKNLIRRVELGEITLSQAWDEALAHATEFNGGVISPGLANALQEMSSPIEVEVAPSPSVEEVVVEETVEVKIDPAVEAVTEATPETDSVDMQEAGPEEIEVVEPVVEPAVEAAPHPESCLE